MKTDYNYINIRSLLNKMLENKLSRSFLRHLYIMNYENIKIIIILKINDYYLFCLVYFLYN